MHSHLRKSALFYIESAEPLHSLAWPLFGDFMSIGVACDVLRDQLRMMRSRGARRHWAYDANRHIALKERIVAARYLRRFGGKIEHVRYREAAE